MFLLPVHPPNTRLANEFNRPPRKSRQIASNMDDGSNPEEEEEIHPIQKPSQIENWTGPNWYGLFFILDVVY
jgi:hypothetical protein